MKRVIDCSVAFKRSVVEQDTDKANRLREDFRKRIVELLAPDLFPTEMANSLLVAERRGRIAVGQAIVFFVYILTTLPSLHPALPDILPRAIAIAAQTGASAYDCSYVALEEQECCELIIADDRLIRRLQGQFPFIVALATLP
jgi:predicted nucleic acid-binding protein